LLAIAALGGTLDPSVSASVEHWRSAVEIARGAAPPLTAPLADRMRHLILLDEVTRQSLWIMDNPALTPDQQRQVGSIIGPEMNKVDAYTTATLKTLLPKSGWFRNSVNGKQITHGAWLVAQHSPDDAFMAYALSQMERLVRRGEVDAMDYALTFDRVRVNKHQPQRYGSQAYCVDGHLALEPIENEKKADTLRAEIGWSKTLMETKGDLEIGKSCVQ